MKEFFKRLDSETLLGGLFGVIAIIAIIIEFCLSDFSTEAFISAIKDIAGTIVAVMVFLLAAKHFFKQVQEAKTFEDRLQKSLADWQDDHSNMVVRKEQYDFETTAGAATCYSLGLKTNVFDFYNTSNTINTGWFLRMPLLKKENYQSGNVVLKFHLNKGTFFEGVQLPKEELAVRYQRLNDLFTGFIADKYKETVSTKGKGQDISITIKKPVESVEDIELLISIIDSMYNAFLVAANLKF